jgi:hypothetical protein
MGSSWYFEELWRTAKEIWIAVVEQLESNGLDEGLLVLRTVDTEPARRVGRMFCIRAVRETDGGTIWSLLEESGRTAVRIGELYLAGQATEEQLEATSTAARSEAWGAFGNTWGVAERPAQCMRVARLAAAQAAAAAAAQDARAGAYYAGTEGVRAACEHAASVAGNEEDAARSPAGAAAVALQEQILRELLQAETA